MHEDKEKMKFEFKNELQGKEGEKQQLHVQFAKETFKLNDIIGKLRNYIDTLLEKLQ